MYILGGLQTKMGLTAKFANYTYILGGLQTKVGLTAMFAFYMYTLGGGGSPDENGLNCKVCHLHVHFKWPPDLSGLNCTVYQILVHFSCFQT